MEKLTISSGSIKATCHCGAITVTVPGKPEKPINECQCTICRRYAAAWAYYSTKVVTIDKQEGALTKKYIWGDKEIEFTWCDNCGCVMYWYPIALHKNSDKGKEIGVNSRMMDPESIKGVSGLWRLNVFATFGKF